MLWIGTVKEFLLTDGEYVFELLTVHTSLDAPLSGALKTNKQTLNEHAVNK